MLNKNSILLELLTSEIYRNNHPLRASDYEENDFVLFNFFGNEYLVLSILTENIKLEISLE